jgi:hypothetical protein
MVNRTTEQMEIPEALAHLEELRERLKGEYREALAQQQVIAERLVTLEDQLSAIDKALDALNRRAR